MDTFFQTCAALGGTVLLLQFLAGLFGHGADHDTDHDHGDSDHGGNWLVSMIGVRTVAAGLTFFGLGGLTAGYYGLSESQSVGVAIGFGAVAFYAVATIVKSLSKLKSDGSVRIDRTVGQSATVYLRIPAGRAGTGKVHVAVQNRTVELPAVTAGPELPTGAAVRVVAVVPPDTVEVEAT
jgi:hypothetical protein